MNYYCNTFKPLLSSLHTCKLNYTLLLVNKSVNHTSFSQCSFLSIQPASHLHFLSHFLETSMFSVFVDRKLISRWADHEQLQQLFDHRLEKERLYDHVNGEDQHDACGYQKCTALFESCEYSRNFGLRWPLCSHSKIILKIFPAFEFERRRGYACNSMCFT